MRIEFHVHTIYSSDSFLTWPFLLLACKLKKIKVLVITDHNEIKGAVKYKNILAKYNIHVIVGEEIFTREGEIIGLFLKEKINPQLSAKETIQAIKKQKGLVYIPHPYDEKRKATVINQNVLEEISPLVDFIEIHNGRNVKNEFSKKQQEIQKKLNIIPIVGSDAHTFYEVGRNYCIVDDYSRQSFVASMKNAAFSKKKCIYFAHINTKFVKLIKMVGRGDIGGIGRSIIKKIRKFR